MPFLRQRLKTPRRDLRTLPDPVPDPRTAPAGEPRDARLDQVAAATVKVVAVDGEDPVSERLRSAGLWPGVVVERLATASFGGPMLFRVQGYRLALRRSEAARVRVAMLEREG